MLSRNATAIRRTSLLLIEVVFFLALLFLKIKNQACMTGEVLHREKPDPEGVTLPPQSDDKIPPLSFGASCELKYFCNAK